jgi:biofilm PGA synthesis N-glycosyltransferase PgaC
MTYALITPARNEAAFIEQTIQAVIRQTVKPAKWMIVSDSSADGTDEIVKRYVHEHPWIELIRMPERAERHFGGKAIAFNAAWERIQQALYDIIGNLDADITFDKDHFEFLLNKFAQDKTLGVAGTPFREGNAQYDYRFSRKEHVSGACQLFRRECFEMIGGYLPLKGGGIDLAAVVTARMRGWKTETFTEKACLHLRPMGKAGPHYLKYTFLSGYGDYRLGVHPVWQLFRSIYQMSKRPWFLSGFLLLLGYFWGMITHPPKPVSEEFVRFRRKEQVCWLKDYYQKALIHLQ